MKETGLTEREQALCYANMGEYSDKELADIFRKDMERLHYIREGEFTKDCRTKQCSVAISCIKQLANDCEALSRHANKSRDKVKAQDMAGKLKKMSNELMEMFNTYGVVAGWWNK